VGTASVTLALLASVVATVASAAAIRPGSLRATALRVASASMLAAAALSGVAVVLLGAALWRVDPALSYVARHSSVQTPGAYRIAAIWGGMEGSLLFWTFVVAGVLAGAVRLQSRAPRADGRDLVALTAVGGITTSVFLLVSLVWASPFGTLAVPTGRGDGLLAVLQHPAMVYHPPILYLGLALTAVPFALTFAALADRRLDDRWRTIVVPWLRTAWIVLGIGIVAGSQWAYAELGWGGFWAWDPVENSSLLPWLAVTIALHLVMGRTEALRLGAAGAIVACFCLVVGGVYLTRSGSTGSIHAFSDSPQVGRPLLLLTAATAAAGFWALARNRMRSTAPTDAEETDPGRAAATAGRTLALHGALGAIAVAAIALGTFWPVVDGLIVSDVGTRRLVQPDYYHRALAPVAAAALAAMAVLPPLLRAQYTPGPGLRQLLVGAVAGALAGLAALAWSVGTLDWIDVGRGAVVAAAGAAVGGALLHATGARSPHGRRRAVGVALAHGGFALVLLGAVAASGGSDHTLVLTVGERVSLGDPGDDRHVTLVEIEAGRTERYEHIRAVVEIEADESSWSFEPELRAYERQTVPTAEAVIAGTIGGDRIVVLEAVGRDLGSATVTVRTRPLLPWVWFGAGLMLLGGALAMLGRPRRAYADAGGAMRSPAGATAPR